MIKAIIFDLGNVVFTNDWHFDYPEKFDAYTSYFHITDENMELAWKAMYPLYLLGKISEDIFWKGFLEKSGAKNIDVAMAQQLWRQYQFENEQMLSLLKKLKQNYKLAALTTTGKEWVEWRTEKFDLHSIFDVIVSSAHTGLSKPDPKIYLLTTEKLGVQPAECIFVDDTETNIIAANNLGMKGILFKNQEQLEEDLSRFL